MAKGSSSSSCVGSHYQIVGNRQGNFTKCIRKQLIPYGKNGYFNEVKQEEIDTPQNTKDILIATIVR